MGPGGGRFVLPSNTDCSGPEGQDRGRSLVVQSGRALSAGSRPLLVASKAAVRERRLGHSRALRRSVETRCRVTPKRSAICSIVMPSACSACASARRTFAPLVSSAFELSVSSWTMSGLSSPETSSVYDAPFERDAAELGDPLLDQACTPAVVGEDVLKRGQSVKEFVFGHWLRSVATIRKDPNRQPLLRKLLLRQLALQQLAIAAMTIALLYRRCWTSASLWRRPAHSDEPCPRRAIERDPYGACHTTCRERNKAGCVTHGEENGNADRCGAPPTARLQWRSATP